MSLSARAQYACLAMLQLAIDYEGGDPTPLRKIAESHGIPAAFLVQILQELKRAGLVVSVRGATGGYRLATSPEQTSLADVVSAFESPESADQFAAPSSPFAQVVQNVCDQLVAARKTKLEGTSLAALAAQSASMGGMWWI